MPSGSVDLWGCGFFFIYFDLDKTTMFGSGLFLQFSSETLVALSDFRRFEVNRCEGQRDSLLSC